jgi:poly-gamma-glutamate biosynthesis protein PgsC/CapC
MHLYPFNTEMARLTIVLGIVIVTLIYKQTGLTLGGIIVPGYLALYVTTPLHIVMTMVIAVLAWAIVHGILMRRYMLNGQRLFEIEILVALVLQVAWNALVTLFSGSSESVSALYGIGFVIPGLIAHEIGRQGVRRTLLTTLLGTVIVFLIITPLAAIEDRLPESLTEITTSPLLRTQPYQYAFPLTLLPIAIIISLVVDLAAFKFFKIRPGGYVTAGYIALFYPRPFDLLFVLGAAIITYLFVHVLASRFTLVFGRIKMGMIVLTGVVIAWLLEILIIQATNGLFAPWSGFVVIMPLLVALLANEFERQNLPRTLAAVAGSSAVVWLSMQVLVLALTLLGWYTYFLV